MAKQPVLRSDYNARRTYFGEKRSDERVYVHYELERRLADRLRGAKSEDRAKLYQQVYTELFDALPDHPQKCGSVRDRREHRIEYLLGRLNSYLGRDKTFLEIGCGDALLSIKVAANGTQTYALDVTDALIDRSKIWHNNPKILISSGTEIALPDNSIDVALSDQLIEHLHPDDVCAQLMEVFRVIKPGGIYHCITPNRVSGPHDISTYFDYEATGFHLQEFDSSSLSALFRQVGFRRIQFFVAYNRHKMLIPGVLLRAIENFLLMAPKSVRAWASRRIVLVTLMGLNVIATK